MFAHVASEGLTRREQEVVALLARGLTNREIATALTITERTAETHVGKILSKLNLRRRAQLTAWAVEHHLTAPAADLRTTYGILPIFRSPPNP
jgi:DNA-binding NarL/FixJ family response regulator